MPQHSISAEEAGRHPAVCAAYIVEGISNADAKSSATEAVVGHFLSVDDVDSAAEFADALEDPFTRDKLLLAVIAKCIELKDDDYAFQLLDAIEDSGIRSGGFEATTHSLAARGDFEKAMETAKELEHSSDSIAGIAIAQAKKGLTEPALETIESIDYVRSRVKAFIEISARFLEKNEYEKAKEWLSKAGEAVPGVEFEEDRIRALTEIANCYLEAEDRESAADYFLKASSEASKLDHGHRDQFLVAAAIGLLKSGSIEIADETLDLVEDKTQVASCLYGFSRVYEKDEPEDARETIEEALAMLNSQSEYEIRSTKDRNDMFGVIAVQFQRVGLTQRAVEIAHENIDESERNRALTGIAQLLVMEGKPNEADEVAKGIEPESEMVSALIGLSDAANTVDDRELAVKYLKKASELLEEVEQMIARASIADEIALRLEAYGENEEAVAIARQNLELISEIKDESGKAQALVRLDSVYKKLGIEPDEDDRSLLATMARKVDW